MTELFTPAFITSEQIVLDIPYVYWTTQVHTITYQTDLDTESKDPVMQVPIGKYPTVFGAQSESFTISETEDFFPPWVSEAESYVFLRYPVLRPLCLLKIVVGRSKYKWEEYFDFMDKIKTSLPPTYDGYIVYDHPDDPADLHLFRTEGILSLDCVSIPFHKQAERLDENKKRRNEIIRDKITELEKQIKSLKARLR